MVHWGCVCAGETSYRLERCSGLVYGKADVMGSSGKWTPRKNRSPQPGLPTIRGDFASSIKRVILYRWYLKRLGEDEGDNSHFVQVAVGGYNDLGLRETERLETLAIEHRIEKCKLKTVDGLYVFLRGAIDEQHTYDNGFSSEVIHIFWSGFPWTWKYVINNYFSANSLPQQNISSAMSCCDNGEQDNEALNDCGNDNENRLDVKDRDENITESMIVDLTQEEFEDGITIVSDFRNKEATYCCQKKRQSDSMGSQRSSESSSEQDGLPGDRVESVDTLEGNCGKITCIDDKGTVQTKEENNLQETSDQTRRWKQDSCMMPPPLPPRRVKTTPEEVSAAFGLKRSRSGRLLVPRLADWCGEKISYDLDGGVIAIFDKSDVATRMDSGYKFQPPEQAKARRMQQKLCDAANEVIVTPKGKKKQRAT